MASFDQGFIGRKEGGTEQGFMADGLFPSEALTVGQEGFEKREAQFRDHIFVHFVEFGLFPSVDQIPKQVQPFDLRSSGSDQGIVDRDGVLQGALQYDAVCRYGGNDIVHPRKGFDYGRVVDGSGQVEKDEIGM